MPTKPSLIGQRFRSSVADAQPLFEVIRKAGPKVYYCTVVDEPTTYNGVTYPGEYAGHSDVFTEAFIETVMRVESGWAQLIKKGIDRTDAFMLSVKPGEVYHVNDSFSKFLRAHIEEQNGTNVFVYDGFVGNWQDHDIKPTRRFDGIATEPYALSRLRSDKYPSYPRAEFVWEAMTPDEQVRAMATAHPPTATQTVNFARYQAPFEPASLPLLDVSAPPLTEATARVARITMSLQDALEALQEVINKTDDIPTLLDAAAKVKKYAERAEQHNR